MIATLTKARKPHLCQWCIETIYPGEMYIRETIPGGGLESLKFPDRYHQSCHEAVKQNRNEECVVTE